jgi:hypothetical protein
VRLHIAFLFSRSLTDLSISNMESSDEADNKKAKKGGKAEKAGGSGSGSGGASAATSKPGKGKGRAPPSSRVPLSLAPKVRRDMLLLEVNDSSLDLSGDFGCIGKLHVRKPGGSVAASSSALGDASGPDAGSVAELRQTVMLDLKGKVYDADILPCNTICLVQVDGSKAKVEAIFSDFVQLGAPRDSIFDTTEIVGGDFGADFFDDGEVLSNDGGDDSDDEKLGPLREHKVGGKKKPAKKKPPAKRKSAGGSGGGAKKKQK